MALPIHSISIRSLFMLKHFVLLFALLCGSASGLQPEQYTLQNASTSVLNSSRAAPCRQTHGERSAASTMVPTIAPRWRKPRSNEQGLSVYEIRTGDRSFKLVLCDEFEAKTSVCIRTSKTNTA